jgi:hypothetical protein
MIASVIGRTLLAEYNRRNATTYSAEEFFENVYHSVFYDHEKYLQYVGNSPYVQGFKKGSPYDKTDRLARLNTLKQKIHSGIAPDASFAIGFAATGAEGTTSGQVTNLSIPTTPEDVYASWIGGGLGIGIQGGFSIYFNNPEILWRVYEGWQVYRRFLKETANLRPNQIDTWNGQWFSHACSDDFDEDFPEIGMTEAFSATTDGGLEIKTQQWTQVLFGVANKFKTQQITGYVFSLGQVNTTVGFVPFELPELVRPLRFYRELFGENEFLDNKDKIQKMYGTAHSFKSACRKGAIGVPALEPKDLVQYMMQGKGKTPDFAKADQEKRISFNVYQTWLLAMLNNKELWQRANDAAAAYLEYESGSKKVSTVRLNAIKEVLDAPTKRKFIEASIKLVEEVGDSAQQISDLVEEVNSLPEDNFRYFQTLIKFRYAFLKSQKQGVSQ